MINALPEGLLLASIKLMSFRIHFRLMSFERQEG